jgi:hypothetical protein
VFPVVCHGKSEKSARVLVYLFFAVASSIQSVMLDQTKPTHCVYCAKIADILTGEQKDNINYFCSPKTTRLSHHNIIPTYLEQKNCTPEKPTPATSGGEEFTRCCRFRVSFQSSNGTLNHCLGERTDVVVAKEWVSPGDRTQVPLHQ